MCHRYIRMQQANIPAQAGDMFFQRAYAQFHIGGVVPDSAYIGANCPKMPKDDIFYAVCPMADFNFEVNDR